MYAYAYAYVHTYIHLHTHYMFAHTYAHTIRTYKRAYTRQERDSLSQLADSIQRKYDALAADQSEALATCREEAEERAAKTIERAHEDLKEVSFCLSLES
jgi:hypothetical protein